MTIWREVEWEYEDQEVYAEIEGTVVLICYVPSGPDTDFIGRAIVQCWNTDIAAARAMGELNADDSVRIMED